MPKVSKIEWNICRVLSDKQDVSAQGMCNSYLIEDIGIPVGAIADDHARTI